MKKLVWFLLIVAVLVYGYKMMNKSKTDTQKAKKAQLLIQKGQYDVSGNNVKYFNETEGYLAKPTAAGAYPGVVMIHESWGLNDDIRNLARLMASNGYTVLAVDLFNGVSTEDPKAAELNVGSLDQEKAILNMRSAVTYLKTTENVPSVASIGWGFGGDQSLKLSLSGEKLDATVIYYGNLLLEEKKLKPLNWPVLGIFGEADKVVPVGSARVFDKVLTKMKVDHTVQIYPGAAHDFTDLSSPNYSANDTLDAWLRTVEFLGKNLK